jgi:hypothetical protein
MIALQARNPQLPDPSRRTAQFANMMNMARQAETAKLQGERTRQEMQYAEAAEGRAVAGEGRAASKFSMEQAKTRVSAVGAGLVGMLRDPSDANLAQIAQTFASVGLDPKEYTGVLSQMAGMTDPNARKLYAREFIAQSPEAQSALKFVVPEVKSEKVGDATVFYDANANSSNFGQELFRFTVAPEPVKMTQNVVDGTLINTNPVTGVAAEAITGDPTQGANLPAREPTFASTGVRSPYAVGAGTGATPTQPSMTPPAAPAVGVPSSNLGGAGQGNTADVVYGFGEFGLPAKPISQSTIGEVQDFQRNTLIPKTRGQIGKGPRIGTGAVGTYQFTYGTLQEIAPKVLGPNWRNTTFTPDVQEQLAKALYNDRKSGNLKDTWAGLPSNRPGQYTNVPWDQVRDKIIQVESAGGGNRRTPTRTPTGGAGKPPATGKPQTVSEQQRQKGYIKTLELFDYDPNTGADSISPLIKASTSGGLEKIGADIAGFIPESMGGGATPGAIAIGQLQSLQDSMTFTKLREKLGAQVSDSDVRLVASTMGDIANAATPAPVRLAKWQNVVLPILVRGAGMKYVKPKGDSGGGTKVIKTLTPEQVRAAPSGTRYKTTDGRELTKP